MSKDDVLSDEIIDVSELLNTDSVEITIDPEFKTLIDPLTSAEYEQLEKNILTEGVSEPLKVWKNEDKLLLIDGHNRYDIATKNTLPFNIIKMNFQSRQDAIIWIANNQLGRRNLTSKQKKNLVGKRYEAEKSQGRRQDLIAGKVYQKLNTDEKIGKEFNMSPKNVRLSAILSKAINNIGSIDSKAKEIIMTEKLKISDEDVIVISKLPLDKKISILNEISKGGDRNKITSLLKTSQELGQSKIPGKGPTLMAAVKLKPVSINDSFNRLSKVVYENKTHKIASIDFLKGEISLIAVKTGDCVTSPLKKCFWPADN